MRPRHLAIVEFEAVEFDAALFEDVEHRGEIGGDRRRLAVETKNTNGPSASARSGSSW
jgi:hypothetical protein